MMKETIGGVEKNNLPRVRFVFSGYRVTKTRADAWANAGSVLRLTPLTAHDSATLVEGPPLRSGVGERPRYRLAGRLSFAFG